MTFSVDIFATECKAAMDAAMDDNEARQKAAAQYLRQVMDENSTEDILKVLHDSIPPGAGVGEMIIHASPELTMLYARIPPHFQSAVHDHTIFACIGCLVGVEENKFYEVEGNTISVDEEFALKPGNVLELDADVIHSIENPSDDTLHALHIYGGDFNAITAERTIWTSDELKPIGFSFPALMKESVKKMKMGGNDAGLGAVVEAIPALKPMVDAIM
eukprot:scaffold83347_cov42-Attheya_sp.AAC.2